jgi:hypothetical protein
MMLLLATIALRVRVRRLFLVLVDALAISAMLIGSANRELVGNPITTGEEASGARGESILLLCFTSSMCTVPYIILFCTTFRAEFSRSVIEMNGYVSR